MTKLKLTLEMGEFELFFDNDNECLKWLLPILVTENWVEYEYINVNENNH